MRKDNYREAMRPEPYLSARQVARLCNVSTKSVYRWGETGEVPVYRAGTQLRFRRHEVEAYLARGASVATAPNRQVWR